MNVEQFCQKYYVERKKTNSVKWDAVHKHQDDEILPVWIADADFKTADEIREACKAKLDFGALGYTNIPQSYIDACLNWENDRYQYACKKEWLRFSHGVVTLINSVINTFVSPQEEVLVCTPVYPPFMNTTRSTNRTLVTFDLSYDEGMYTIDFNALEELLKNHQIKLFIHCNPHNPIGRVWTKDEQDKIVALMKKYDVLIISDEIHQDLTFDKHYPTALAMDHSYSQNIITVNSLSKTYSLAGCSVAQAIIEDDEKRERYDRYVDSVIHGATDLLGFTACEAGYLNAESWLDGFKQLIQHNDQLLRNELKDLPIIISPLQGTYLAWINLSQGLDENNIQVILIHQAKLLPNFGETFSPKTKGFIRLNLATHPDNIIEAAKRIRKVIKK